jgi:acyl carrier protein
VPVLRPGRDEVVSVTSAAAAAWVRGAGVDWARWFAGAGARRVELPTYAFVHERFWPRPAVVAGDVGAGLFVQDWVPVAAAAGDVGWAVIGDDGGELAAALDAARYPGLAELAAAVTAGAAVPAAVAVLVAGPPGAVPGDAAGVVAGQVLELVQRWLAEDRLAQARLVVVTRGAVAAADGDRVADLVAAAARGLVRSAQTENPGRLMLADIDEPGPRVGARLAAALASGEAEVALRGERVLARRLVPAVRPSPAVGGGHGGAVLVTGGTGTLGGLVARHLAARGQAGRLVLASRSGPGAPGIARLAARLAGLGAGTLVAACDAADRDALAGLLTRVGRGPVPLTGVVHAAGVLDDGVIGSLTPARVEGVVRPKAAAAWYLHELTQGIDLDQFVLFSSAAGVLGSGGQGNYAAGNAFLDGLAQFRRERGLAGVSLAWGLWAAGMTAGLAEVSGGRTARTVMGALSPREGLALLDAARDHDQAVLVPARFDAAMLRAAAAAGRLPALLDHLVSGSARRAAAGTALTGTAPTRAGLAARLAGLDSIQRDQVLLDVVQAEVAAVLGHASPDAVPVGRPFKDLGFDSLTAVELRNRLAAVTGQQLPATLVFDYPTAAALAEYIGTEVTGGKAAASQVLGELDRLKEILSAVAPDGVDRLEVTARLEALLNEWRGGGNVRDDIADQELETATDDEMFDLLDKEL